MDPDKAFAVQIQHDESVVSTTKAYVQCALLYTSSFGERRIRCVGGPARLGPFCTLWLRNTSQMQYGWAGTLAGLLAE